MDVKLSRLKRFDKDKHEQLEGLLQWCQLMGLSGRDLVSLGGHIDRMQQAEEAKRNRAIAEGYVCAKVGSDSEIDRRFTIETINGRYKFSDDGWHSVEVTSYRTKSRKIFRIPDYNVGSVNWAKRWRYQALVAVHCGTIQLDF